jgi:ribosomal protein S18 acetylase RimI-like enzyme
MARIREIVFSDIPHAVEILAAAEPWASSPNAKDDLLDTLRNSLGRGTMFVAEEEAAPAGIVSFTPEPVLGGGGCIRFIVISSDKRRRGIGRQLMGFVERKIFNRSLSVYTCVSAANQPGLRFFEKLGYRRVGEVSDAPVDSAVILRKAAAGAHYYRTARKRVVDSKN